MRYIDFRDTIRQELLRCEDGLTWTELRDRLQLPYDRPCPNWVQRLEAEIGLIRVRGARGAYVWRIHA